MTMPFDIVLVRHGQSEGNIAVKRSEKGDHSYFKDAKYVNRHNSDFRLTDLGINQAKSVGLWLRENGFANFDRYYVSQFVRARETAALLDLEDARWFVDINLRERDWRELDNLSDEDRRARFEDSYRQQKLNALYWCPPNGITLADLLIRLCIVICTLHRECEHFKVVMVCHGEVMWMLRYYLERMSQERFLELESSKNPLDRIHNCQIIHYTRRSLSGDGSLFNRFERVRSMCPWDTTKSRNEFEHIVRPNFTNEELLANVIKYPPIIEG